MKICHNCGAKNADHRFFCIDCNEKLGNPISKAEQEQVEQQTQDRIDALYNRNDPLYVSRLDKAIGIFALIGIAANAALGIVGWISKPDVGTRCLSALFFAVAAIEALVPKLTWSIEQLRLSFTVDGADDAEPSAFYKTARKISIIVAATIGTVILALTAVTM